jgi:hypothetical protein
LFLWRSTGRQKFSVGQCSVDLFCEDGFARQGLDVDQYVHGTILHIVESVEELGPSSKLELTFLGVLPLADFHHASGRGTGGTVAKTTILSAGALMVLSGGIANGHYRQQWRYRANRQRSSREKRNLSDR